MIARNVISKSLIFGIVALMITTLPSIPSISATENDAEIAIKVEDRTISMKKFRTMVSKQVARMNSKLKQSPRKSSKNVSNKKLKMMASKQVKRSQINRLLLETNAEKSKVKVPQSEVQKRWNNIAERAGSEEKLRNQIQKSGKSVKDVQQKIEKSILIKKFLDQNVEDVTVSNEEVRSYYENNKAQFRNMPFEKVKQYAKKALKQKKKQKARQNFINQLRKNANVTVNV